MIARVAIDLALDRLFDYEVPEELKKKLATGQLLLVPFGPRVARGFVMELLPKGIDLESVRVGLESNRAGLGANRVGLGSDSSDSSTTLKDANLKDSNQTLNDSKRPYVLKKVKAIVDETPFFSANLLKLVKSIAAYTAAPIETVLRAAIPAAVVKPDAKPRELVFVEPRPSVGEVALTKRQQWLCDQIVRLGGGWMQQLCRELKTTPETLKALGEKGLVAIEVRAKRRDPLVGRRILPSRPLPLNDGQRKALDAILSSKKPVLLHGVTGSGKTEVYLQAIASELENGRGAIVMVPEIALTPQTVQRFVSRFGDCVAVLHSALSNGERYDEWHRIRSNKAKVVIGPRSAVFAPVKNLGLIVVDEEHETSYKQDETPRYNARDAAVMRGAIEGARVVLGSATPSLESWLNAQSGKYELASMPLRAGAGTPPRALVVDMNVPSNRGKIFSVELLDELKLRLDRGEQSILFLNRRGWSRSVRCEECGLVLECPDCSVPYVYHQADSCCRCHICGGWISVPRCCPQCGSQRLVYKGIGTQRAEEALKKCFPKARVLRMDADSTSRKNSHDDILGAFRRHEADILLGTQMIAKGLDFPNVTLVGVLNADSSLSMPDFRAAERTFQLLSQVSGRAGRAELPGDSVIQTYDPSSSVILSAAKGDFAAFAKDELAERKAASYPPFCHLSTVSLSSKDPKLVSLWADMYSKSLSKVKGVIAGEAVPCALEKAEGRYRWQIVLRSGNAASVVRAWKWLLGVRPPPSSLKVHLDVDAVSLM